MRIDPPKGGILINAVRNPRLSPTSPLPQLVSPSSPSSASSDPSDYDSAAKPPSRRITFAPLPNPRALDSPQVPTIVLHNNSDLPYDHPEIASSFDGEDVPNGSPALVPKKSSSWGHSTKQLLKPFYKPLAKAATLDVGDGGALGLFRSSSRESTASSAGTLTDSATAPLTRRMSTGSQPFHMGANGHLTPDRHPLALTPITSELGASSSAGTRLLNGRVYGGSRVKQAKQEAAPDPEFVEWGYGGMGSNRGHTTPSAYAKVQSSHANVVAHDHEDEDDGSGMGWVRKRREAREREKKERETKEAAEKEEIIQKANQPDLQEKPVVEEHITQAITVPVRHPHPHHHPPNRRRSSDAKSTGSGSGTATPSHIGSGKSTPMIRTLSAESTSLTPKLDTIPSEPSPLSQSPMGSESDEDDSGEDSDDAEGENQDTEKEDTTESEVSYVTFPRVNYVLTTPIQTETRKTSQCAGVEKISRHKE